jgi:MFS family permease
MLMVPNLAVLIVAQLVFGGAIGLIYASSLFYSMDAGDMKGEHGGIHEAAIGLGNFGGPAVGAVSLHFLPQYANSGSFAVSALLVCGLCGLVAIRWTTRAQPAAPPKFGRGIS